MGGKRKTYEQKIAELDSKIERLQAERVVLVKAARTDERVRLLRDAAAATARGDDEKAKALLAEADKFVSERVPPGPPNPPPPPPGRQVG